MPEGWVDGSPERCARGTERIHRSRFDQALLNAAIEQLRVHRPAELVDVIETPATPARFADPFGGVFANILDRRQAKSDGLSHRSEVQRALMHIRGEHLDTHDARLVDVLHHLIGVARFRGQQRGHELDRVVRFQPRRLVGQQRVGTRVGFIEAVPSKFGDQIEDALGFLWRNLVGAATSQELLALGGHFLALLLAHGAAQDVRLAQRKARQTVGDLHHLLLVEDDAISFLQDFLQYRQVVGDFLPPVLAIDEVVDHSALDGSRTVEGVKRGQVFQTRRLVAAQDIAHAVGFKLEDAGGFATAEGFVGIGVVQRKIIEGNFHAAVLLDQFHAVIQHGERGQAKKIHL